MTEFQKLVKYLAIALAVVLIVGIFGGIAGVLGIFSGLSGGDAVTGDLKTYPVDGDVTSLKLQLNAAELTVKTAQSFTVESNLKKLEVDVRGGSLVIRDRTKSVLDHNDAVLTVGIPEGVTLDSLEISTGAARFTAETLSARRMKLELGAGAVQIGELNASDSAEIEGGAGAITVSGGVLKDLELDMGVGELNMRAAVLGSSELHYGVGQANLTLVGTAEDYRIEVEKGLGSIRVDGQEIKNEQTVGSGPNRIEIEGGVGSSNIRFASQ